MPAKADDIDICRCCARNMMRKLLRFKPGKTLKILLGMVDAKPCAIPNFLVDTDAQGTKRIVVLFSASKSLVMLCSATVLFYQHKYHIYGRMEISKHFVMQPYSAQVGVVDLTNHGVSTVKAVPFG